jgi:hypothetical protein
METRLQKNTITITEDSISTNVLWPLPLNVLFFKKEATPIQEAASPKQGSSRSRRRMWLDSVV